MTADTITAGAWLADVVAIYGPPEKTDRVPGIHRLRRSWKWTVRDSHLLVAIVDFDDSTELVLYVEFGTIRARVEQSGRFAAGQVRDVLRAVGVLPPLAPALDCGGGSWWMSPEGTARRVCPGDDPASADRPMWADS